MNGRMAWGLVAGILIGGAAMAEMPTPASADDTSCGSKANPCPLQKWMRQNMAASMASGDMTALGAAFDKVAAFSPDPKWNGGDAKSNWDAIARAGSAAAKANDAAGVKASCKTCHDAYKDKYKASYRTKPAP
jgi:hypothetical protein